MSRWLDRSVLGGLVVILAGCSTGSPPGPGPSLAPAATPEPEATATEGAVTSPMPAPTPSSPPASLAELFLVTAFDAAELVILDPEEGEIDRITVGDAPWGVAVAPDGTAYVATLDGVAVVDVARRRVERTIAHASTLAPGPDEGEYRAGGLGIAASPDGSRVYVGVTTRFPDPGVLEVIDTASGSVVGMVPVGIRQFDVVVSAGGDEVYAINHDSFDVTVIDAGALEVVRTLRAAPLGDDLGLGSWNKPHYAALTPDGTLLMAYKGVLLLELDPRTGESTTRPLRSSTHSQGVELTPDGRRLLVVGDGPDDTSLEPPSLEIVDLADDSSVVVPLDGSHNDAAVSADGRFAFVSGGSSREDAPHPDVVTVVDLDSGTVVAAHPVAGNPLIIVRWSGPA